MKKVIKQVAGIDVAMDELVVSFGRMYEDCSPEKCSGKSFPNTGKGFGLLRAWVKELSVADIPVRFVMEATGIYHEKLAYWLHDQDLSVSIVLPNKISNYARSLNVKTVTDKTASESILLFGLERKLDSWAPPKGIYKKLQQLTRERSQLIEERTMIKNQLHAEKLEMYPNIKSCDRAMERIVLLDLQEKQIMTELASLIKSDPEVQRIILLLGTIPGIGMLTAATVLGETNGFELIRNKKQLTSYAGLDVREKQSGTSVRGKARISKRGNKHLRKSMHMPALAAIRHTERYKAIFVRLVSRNGIKMKAAVAVQRKLLEMCYTIFKNNKPFDKKYLEMTVEQAAGI